MASLHRDAKSPFWYLRHKDADGKWKSRATPYRHAIAAETRKARQLEADTTATERANTSRTSPAWKTWVPQWIASHFTTPLTRNRVEVIWSAIEAFLTEKDLRHPALVERQHCFAYFEWRKTSRKRKAPTHHNTILLELKYLAQILSEAKARGYISENPARSLGIKKIAAKQKAALTDEQIIELQAELERRDKEAEAAGEKPWMSRCFKIALCHGVRLRETQVPMSDVNLSENVIVFNKTKGGKPFGAIIHPALRPDLERWKASGDEFTCELPSQAPRMFHRIFKHLGIPSSFHATRVTVATRMAIGGIDERIAKLYLNHSSSLVHSIYVKLRPEHAAGVSATLVYPGHNAPSSETSP